MWPCMLWSEYHCVHDTVQSCSGAWVWLTITLVIVSCTRLNVLFAPTVLFSNFIQLVPILFTPVQLCTILNFWENFICLDLARFCDSETIDGESRGVFHWNKTEVNTTCRCLHGLQDAVVTRTCVSPNK